VIYIDLRKVEVKASIKQAISTLTVFFNSINTIFRQFANVGGVRRFHILKRLTYLGLCMPMQWSVFRVISSDKVSVVSPIFEKTIK
jgi:hypothetical protein